MILPILKIKLSNFNFNLLQKTVVNFPDCLSNCNKVFVQKVTVIKKRNGERVINYVVQLVIMSVKLIKLII